MNRLTGKDELGYYMPLDMPLDCLKHRGECVDLLGAYEDTGLTPGEVRSLWGEWNAMLSVLNSIGSYDRLREFANADKDGRLVVLPCKVGDTVWFRSYIRNGDAALGIQPHAVTNTSAYVVVHGEVNDISIPVKQCGKTWFLTREEAEQALKEAKKDG